MADHTSFIVAAYAVTALVLMGMLAAILIDGRVQRRQLADLSARLGSRDSLAAGGLARERDGDDEP